MVRLSTIMIIAGIVLLPVPIPPFATIAGLLLIVAGIALRVVTDL
ncbi:transporter [Natronorubrum sp. DTA28]